MVEWLAKTMFGYILFSSAVWGDELQSTDYFPLEGQKQWVEDDERVITTMAAGGVVDAGGHTDPVETTVQRVVGGRFDGATYYWSNGAQGLRLHKINYPQIESATVGAAAIDLEFVPPVPVIPTQTTPYNDAVTQQGNVRYEIVFEPADQSRYRSVLQNNHAATSLSWSYSSMAQLRGREAIDYTDQTSGQRSLCTTHLVWEMIIKGRIVGQGDIEVKLTADRWLAEAVGTLKQQERIEVQLGDENMQREVLRSFQYGTDTAATEVALPVVTGLITEEETEDLLEKGWNLTWIDPEETSVEGCSNLDWVARYGVDGVWKLQDLELDHGEQRLSQAAVENSTLITSTREIEAAWVKMWNQGGVNKPDLSAEVPLRYQGLREGWNLLPLLPSTTLSELKVKLTENGFVLHRWFAQSGDQKWVGGRQEEESLSVETLDAIWVYLGL